MPLTPGRYVEAIRLDLERMVRAIEATPEARVAGCPEWDVAALGDHVAEVHTFWALQLRTRGDEPVRPNEVPALEQAGLQLLGALETAKPDDPCWNWSGQEQRASWVFRRMAQETAVHRWDAEAAASTANPIEPDLAMDGIDELFDMFLPAALDEGLIPDDRRDLGGSWLLRATDVEAERWAPLGLTGGTPALTSTGAASDLLLLLWNRPADVDHDGDGSILERWRSLPIYD